MKRQPLCTRTRMQITGCENSEELSCAGLRVCVRVREKRGTVRVVLVLVTCARDELVFVVGSCSRCVRARVVLVIVMCSRCVRALVLVVVVSWCRGVLELCS